MARESQRSESSPSEMGASLASPRSGRAGLGWTYEVRVHEERNEPAWSSPNHPSLLVSYSPHSRSQLLGVKACPGHKGEGLGAGAG